MRRHDDRRRDTSGQEVSLAKLREFENRDMEVFAVDFDRLPNAEFFKTEPPSWIRVRKIVSVAETLREVP
jgi:hypothetical protein